MGTLFRKRTEAGSCYYEYESSGLDVSALPLKIREGEKESRSFSVYAQHAEEYGEWSEYLRRHGCACCSLTLLLGMYCDEYEGIRPERTISEIERKHFGSEQWERNYSRKIADQMPVSQLGISRILSEEGIPHRYIQKYRPEEAWGEIRAHLLTGKPVVIIASRIRYKNGLIISINDRKYAGSYHTMVLLGLNRQGKVVFADSASRKWAGQRQRIKEARMADLMHYMFPVRKKEAKTSYFSGRWDTGGYILIDKDPLDK